MTTNSEILEVLHSHYREVNSITVEKVTDCTDFWDALTSEVFMSIPARLTFPYRDETRQFDSAINLTMLEFPQNDDLALVNKQGRILKRLGKAFKTRWGVSLPDNIAGIIGDKIQYFVSNESDVMYYDFTDKIDWHDGQFGKDDSCWFPGGCYEQSREVYTDNGGWGIRFYNSMDGSYDNGIGRCWVLPRKGMLFCFNAYGISRPKVSKTLKAIFNAHGIKLHYKVMDKLYNSRHDDIPYINTNSSSGSSGAFVMYPDDMALENVPLVYDIDMQVDSDYEDESNYETCENCNRRIDMDSGNWNSINGYIYCERCTDNLFSYCDGCEEYCDESEVHKTDDGNFYCEDCLKRKGYTKCYQCDDWHKDTITDSDGDTFCEGCAESYLYHCEKCNQYLYTSGDSESTLIMDHDCTELDTSNLWIMDDYNLHAKLTRNTEVEYHQTTVYKIPDVDGLVLFDVSKVNPDASGWNISHELSGLALKGQIPSFKRAKALFLAVGHLADWNLPADDIQHTEAFPKILQAIKDNIS